MHGRLKIAALAAMILIAPQALADVCTTDANGRPRLSCNDPANPKCWFNPSRQEWKCTCRDCVPCASRFLSYSCPPGYRCYGDGSSEPRCRRG